MSGLTATPIERDIVIVRGADAGGYLQTQLSQDVSGIADGGSMWSFLLTPKSDILALMRITRSSVDELILDMDPGWGDTVRQTIDEFLFRMDVEFEQSRWTGIAWRGGIPDLVDAPISAETPWEGIDGVDMIGPAVLMPDGAEVRSVSDLERVRIASGWPSMGMDIGPSITPVMTGLVPLTVGFEKGCYTGQEFVARVHYRGAEPPKRLIRLEFDDAAIVESGTPIVIGGDDVGYVTSASRGVALGYLKRGNDTPSGGLVSNVEVRLLAVANR